VSKDGVAAGKLGSVGEVQFLVCGTFYLILQILIEGLYGLVQTFIQQVFISFRLMRERIFVWGDDRGAFLEALFTIGMATWQGEWSVGLFIVLREADWALKDGG